MPSTARRSHRSSPRRNTFLGGGTGTYGLTLCQLDALVGDLGRSFADCMPSSFAQAHLCRPGFQPGEFCTDIQGIWATDPSGILSANFATVYAPLLGILAVGVTNGTGFAMLFTYQGVTNYLPAAGPIGPLDSNLVDPTFSASGAFGGEVVALQLNVDFSAAGFLHSTGVPFGNLKLCNITTFSVLNGQTVAQILTEANTLLGGGTGTYGLTITDLYPLSLN